jgi:murein DD-endopeptidase MepM/ murein hydrolase activator NlpD
MTRIAAARSLLAAAFAAGVLGAAAPARAVAQGAVPLPSNLPPLPDSSGWGTHILALARGPDGAIWVGTYGRGIFVLRPGADAWERIHAGAHARSISWDYVHAFGFSGRDVWYGTVGNGWGVTRDGGRTWQNWSGEELGARWRYVTPNGIVTLGDTVFIATADGIRWSTTGGALWAEANDSAGGLPSRYVLAVAPARGGGLWVSTLRGVGRWSASGTWRTANPNPVPSLGQRVRALFPIEAPGALVPFVPGGESCIGALRPRGRRSTTDRWECLSLFRREGVAGASIRALGGCDGVLCAGATSRGAVYGSRVGLQLQPAAGAARSRDIYAVLTPPPGQPGDTLFGSACGFVGHQPPACLTLADSAGARAPREPRHTWFARPIAPTDQPFIDQTYRYGSTFGGLFQQHQGVEFNNPVGTRVLAIGAGTVVFAGRAEQGALTVAIRHDSVLTTPQGRFVLFSTYYHNARLLVRAGQRVARGEPIARVGNTGRATNDHLHLEVHAAPVDSLPLIVDPENRFPPFTRNPELWIEPLPGTGIVAGQVWDADGRPVRQARIYGLVKPEPQETPFSFAETYGDRANPDPVYGEHFAVGDVPPGEYQLGVEIDGQAVFRIVRVEAGRLTWVELRP